VGLGFGLDRGGVAGCEYRAPRASGLHQSEEQQLTALRPYSAGPAIALALSI
jgi:hypothetical protein